MGLGLLTAMLTEKDTDDRPRGPGRDPEDSQRDPGAGGGGGRKGKHGNAGGRNGKSHGSLERHANHERERNVSLEESDRKRGA